MHTEVYHIFLVTPIENVLIAIKLFLFSNDIVLILVLRQVHYIYYQKQVLWGMVAITIASQLSTMHCKLRRKPIEPCRIF